MKYINERLGVPDNIVTLAESIYNVFLDYTKYYGKFKKLKTSFFNRDKIKIGDIIAPNFRLEIKIDVVNKSKLSEKYEIGSLHTMGFAITSNIDKTDFKNKRLIIKGGNSPTIKVNIVSVEKDTDSTKLYEFLKTNKDEYISSISHELMHFYDIRKRGYETIDSKSDYSTFQKSCIFLKSIKDFWFYMYYTSIIEEAVRSSEVAGEIYSKKISKNEFYSFLKNNETYKKLQEIKNFTYDSFINNIKSDILDEKTSIYINDFLSTNCDYTISEMINKSIDYKIELLLKLAFFEYATNKRDFISTIVNHLEDVDDKFNTKEDTEAPKSLIELINRLTGSTPSHAKHLRGEIANDILKKVRKYKDNPSDFFKNTIKEMNISSTRTIKKISKLYDIADDDKSIKDWDLHQAINNRGNKYINKHLEKFNSFKK